MAFDTETLTAADTAVLLRAKLGALRAWSDFLTDSIRGKQSIHGLKLLPCCTQKRKGLYRPMYSLAQTNAFIEEVLMQEPSAGKYPIKPTVLPIDPKKNWRLNRFEEDGSPTIH